MCSLLGSSGIDPQTLNWRVSVVTNMSFSTLNKSCLISMEMHFWEKQNSWIYDSTLKCLLWVFCVMRCDHGKEMLCQTVIIQRWF